MSEQDVRTAVDRVVSSPSVDEGQARAWAAAARGAARTRRRLQRGAVGVATAALVGTVAAVAGSTGPGDARLLPAGPGPSVLATPAAAPTVELFPPGHLARSTALEGWYARGYQLFRTTDGAASWQRVALPDLDPGQPGLALKPMLTRIFDVASPAPGDVVLLAEIDGRSDLLELRDGRLVRWATTGVSGADGRLLDASGTWVDLDPTVPADHQVVRPVPVDDGEPVGVPVQVPVPLAEAGQVRQMSYVAGDLWAGGPVGDLLRWTGGAWRPVDLPHLDGYAGTTTDLVYAEYAQPPLAVAGRLVVQLQARDATGYAVSADGGTTWTLRYQHDDPGAHDGWGMRFVVGDRVAAFDLSGGAEQLFDPVTGRGSQALVTGLDRGAEPTFSNPRSGWLLGVCGVDDCPDALHLTADGGLTWTDGVLPD